MGRREWGDWSKVVGYKDLEILEKFDRVMIWPNVVEISLKIVGELGGGVVRAVVLDAEDSRIGPVGV